MSEPDITFGNPTVLYEEDYHEYTFFTPGGDGMARVVFDYIDEEGSGKLFCEMSVWWLLGQPGSDPILGPQRMNLLGAGVGATGWKQTIDRLETLVDADIAWFQAIEAVKRKSILQHRATASVGRFLEWTEPDDAKSPFLFKPWISSSGITLFYAPGGSNKSMIALALSLSVATGAPILGTEPNMTGRVVYVDFEDEADPHNLRMTAFAKSVGLTKEDVKGRIHHERVTGSLRDAVRRIRTIARNIDAALVVVDSVGLARGGDVSASDITIKLFKSLMSIGIPIVAIDHMTKEDMKRIAKGKMDPREAMAIGSQYTMSSTRLAWFFQLLPESTPDRKVFNIHNTKHNHVPKQPPMGLVFNIKSNENDIPTKASFELQSGLFNTSFFDEPKRLLIAKTIEGAGRPLSGTELAEATGIKPATVRSELKRDLDEGDEAWFEKTEKDGASQPYRLSLWGSVAVVHAQGEPR